jgi:hypothetical protein
MIMIKIIMIMIKRIMLIMIMIKRIMLMIIMIIIVIVIQCPQVILKSLYLNF